MNRPRCSAGSANPTHPPASFAERHAAQRALARLRGQLGPVGRRDEIDERLRDPHWHEAARLLVSFNEAIARGDPPEDLKRTRDALNAKVDQIAAAEAALRALRPAALSAPPRWRTSHAPRARAHRTARRTTRRAASRGDPDDPSGDAEPGPGSGRPLDAAGAAA
jgi:hypothetical protein